MFMRGNKNSIFPFLAFLKRKVSLREKSSGRTDLNFLVLWVIGSIGREVDRKKYVTLKPVMNNFSERVITEYDYIRRCLVPLVGMDIG